MPRFTIIGTTGFADSPITYAVLETDHDCRIITQSRIGKNRRYRSI